MSIKKIICLPAVIGLLAAVSCTRDNTSIDGPGNDTRGDAQVTIALQMPALYSSQEATVDENMVKTAYILSFKSGNGIADGDELFDYSSLAYSVTDGDASRYKNVRVSLLKKDHPQKLVLITNAKLAVEGLDLQPGVKTKKEVLEALEFSQAGEWHSEMAAFVPIPMWGETAGGEMIDDDTKNIGTVVLTRMVSRIDIIKDTAIGDDLFTLTSVHLYNHLNSGMIAPKRASTHWDDTEWKAIYPTLPSQNQKIKGPKKVDAVTTGTSPYLPTVYTFETEAPAGGTAADASCVVIGGKFDGAAAESFYRVDFVEKDDNETVTGYKHLLRNHIYRVNITDVYGNGHPTPDEAFDSQAVNIDAEVKEWDEGSITDVVFDKDHMLGVSQTEYALARNASTDNLLIVTTDVPEGGTLTCDADWLTLGRSQFPAGGKEDVIFSVTENTTGAQRTAKITVSARNLSIVVTVVQGINEKYSLEITENGEWVQNLLFTSYGDEHTCLSRSLKAQWTPVSEACMVSYFIAGNYGLGFETRINPFTSETVIYGGDKSYTVYPDDITAAERQLDPFMEKGARANLIVGEGNDAIVKTLTMRQVHYDLLAQAADTYPLDGGKYSFTLTTNAAWEVSVSGNDELANLDKTSGEPVTGGEPFYFTMANDPDNKITDRSMTLTFKYYGEDGRFGTKTVVINAEPGRKLKDAPAANSYILEPEGDGVAIPLSWANGSPQGTLISSTDDVKVKVLWLDTDRGIADNSVISNYELKGNGSNGTIEVYPGSQEGNALIAAMVGNEIKWSWHIWVTNFDVEGTAYSTASQTWMNINLGAITNTPGIIDSYGLFYQFGRKDPFPRRRSATLTDNVQQNLWDEDKNPVTITFASPSATDNIKQAVSSPTTFYRGVSGNNNDWTSSGTLRENDLWNDGASKTHYDPCPGGWRTPVPASGSGSAFTDMGTAGSGQNTGWYFSSYSSHWQFGGMITHNGSYQAGRENNSAMEGLFWGSTTNNQGTMSFSFHISQYYPNASAEIQRASGMNVRCVKDK